MPRVPSQDYPLVELPCRKATILLRPRGEGQCECDGSSSNSTWAVQKRVASSEDGMSSRDRLVVVPLMLKWIAQGSYGGLVGPMSESTQQRRPEDQRPSNFGTHAARLSRSIILRPGRGLGWAGLGQWPMDDGGAFILSPNLERANTGAFLGTGAARWKHGGPLWIVVRSVVSGNGTALTGPHGRSVGL